MITLSTSDVWGMWIGLNKFMFAQIDSPNWSFVGSGYRKVTMNIILHVHRWGLLNWNIETVGFHQAKWKQLNSIYYPEEGIAKFEQQRKDNDGKTVSLCIDMVGVKKKEDVISSTKGPCLKNIVFCYNGGTLAQCHIFYRTTEVTKKFFADLVFLDFFFKEVVSGARTFMDTWIHIPYAYCHVKQFPVIDILIPNWRSWSWMDRNMKTKVSEYIDLLKRGNIPSYGMVKNTALWWVSKRTE